MPDMLAYRYADPMPRQAEGLDNGGIMGEYDSDPKVKATIKSLKRNGREIDPLIKVFLVGIFIGLIAGQLAWDRPEKQPDYVMTSDDRVIVVIQKLGKAAYIFTRPKESRDFEFKTELKPDSPYYPMHERAIMGQKAWPFNPKFNEWVENWKKVNKFD